MHEVYPSHHRHTQLDSHAFQKKGGWVFSWRDTIQKKSQGMEISLRQNRAFKSETAQREETRSAVDGLDRLEPVPDYVLAHGRVCKRGWAGHSACQHQYRPMR